ncbi:B12-binding domain-containing radical SAM protein [Acaryochloris sp. 'Moss Beach']|uniref:B12-binding domain-containing radical SAM protein n=1 Tax=Acaryochloris TaxID=155977 RepID=UPI001BB0C2FE|nr:MULTISPECIES: B12-binding domain-containing radical SAM protein [Acaryochloris]QUY41512.1 B12-binding domain-containing radical SAM protein [Acaryochloris marina S15]UJB70687.1 B12-binding domain-containing radical SAM protein [Acaryochloris sp. 'Moss Beach']
MRVLLIYPLFPKSFWSFEKTLSLVDKKALLPPLGLVTVAAILPQEWEFRLIDRNIEAVPESDWDWAEMVILSGMIVQKEDMVGLVEESHRRGKKVAVGGPFATSVPQDLQAVGADYLILDEGELTLPMFIEAIERGDESGIYRATEKPAVTDTPIPRFDLLKFPAYDNMSVQFSRGCPFQCEFCDIIVLYGRKPRTKTPEQLIGELDRLCELGWRGNVFMVDDNFIGNKRNVKLLLTELRDWMAEKDYPFSFATEASVDLAQDEELMDLMIECNFNSVFLGIETPDEDSLKVTKKFQNTRDSLSESIDTMSEKGLRIMAGFIIGFDGEKKGAGDRITRFVEKTNIPIALFSMLQALPNTALWHRLEKEGRLIQGQEGTGNQTSLMNYVPTRPIDEIANEYVEAFCNIYDPVKYLDRTYRHFMSMKIRPKYGGSGKSSLKVSWIDIRALSTLAWRQGVVRETRWKFWINLFRILLKNPQVFTRYLSASAFIEHFMEYRQIVREEIESQLAVHLENHPRVVVKPAEESPKPEQIPAKTA